MSRVLALSALAALLSLSGCTTESTPVVRVVATPVFTPGAGTYSAPQTVTISDATPSAAIYYTTNGTTPTLNSTLYAAPITVASSETIKAIAIATDYDNSAVATAVYTIAEPFAATPIFAPTPGSYTSAISVTISDATQGAAIYYTTNGTTPTASSTLYAGAIPVSATTTFEAIAIAPGYQNSAVATATYTISLTANQWTWMAGSQLTNQPAVYGTMGIPAAANTPAGRGGSAAMNGPNDSFWLFGGAQNLLGSPLNDLWLFNPNTREWEWVSGSNQTDSPGSYGTKGVFSASNNPSARSSVSGWADHNGNLWIYGGITPGSNGSGGPLNDLWEFDVSRQMWAWIEGTNEPGQHPTYGTKGVASPTTNPGGGTGSTSCTDNQGNLWLFGGGDYGSDQQIGNSLWEFNVTTSEWAWVTGNTLLNSTGEYGTQGVAATTNTPGSRLGATCWGDNIGNIWLFGGDGFDNNVAQTVPMELNDLWKFNIATGEWTWESGSSTRNALGSYGTQGVEAASNVPSARSGVTGWADHNGNLWIFGGSAIDTANIDGTEPINDLWRYNPANGRWTWMSGSSTPDAPSVYGTLGVPAAANTPGARGSNTPWVDSNGDLWLFGQGDEYDGVGVTYGGTLNDVWRYQP